MVSVAVPLVPVYNQLHITEADRNEHIQRIHPTHQTCQKQTNTVKEQNINTSTPWMNLQTITVNENANSKDYILCDPIYVTF